MTDVTLVAFPLALDTPALGVTTTIDVTVERASTDEVSELTSTVDRLLAGVDEATRVVVSLS
jgi:hypothetical protein